MTAHGALRIFPDAPITEPLPVPSGDPDSALASHMVTVCIAVEYVPYILGALEV